MSKHIQVRLEAIRGEAHRRSPNVRTLAAFAQHSRCNLAALGFAAGVNFDRLLVRTRFKMSFGQSPFAISRGYGFEKLLREDDYAATRQLFASLPGFPATGARIINLRQGFPKNASGMPLRAEATLRLLEQIVRREPASPHLIDGAVLSAMIAGRVSFFEADALAAWAAEKIHAAEVKSFPQVDGQVDPDKLGAALDQVAMYIMLVREAIQRLGGDPERFVSDHALLVTPKNVGMTPTLSQQSVKARIDRNRKLVNSIPEPAKVLKSVPKGFSFGQIADTQVGERIRLDVLSDIADRVGTCYEPTCLSNCGNAKFCRERAFRAGSPVLAGTNAVRLLPEIQTLDRANELARGVVPTPAEAPAAALLERAGRLYDHAVSAVG